MTTEVRGGAVGILLALAVTAGLALVSRVDPVRVVVEGRGLIAPALVRFRVSVVPDAANSGVTVVGESEEFSRSSYESLAGSDGPRTSWVEWRDVPAGVYTVTAIVTRGMDAPWRARTGFTVHGIQRGEP